MDITLAEDFYTLYDVRTVETTISDSGRFKQNYDTVNFANVYSGKYNLDNLHAQGYRTMAVEITMDIREVDDGFQYIFIYDDATKTYLRGAQIDHGGNSTNKNYSTYTFYLEIDISNVNHNNFVIRYGASGAFSDDWKNKNVKIQVGWSTETVKTEYIWSLERTSTTTYTATRLPIAK